MPPRIRDFDSLQLKILDRFKWSSENLCTNISAIFLEFHHWSTRAGPQRLSIADNGVLIVSILQCWRTVLNHVYA